MGEHPKVLSFHGMRSLQENLGRHRNGSNLLKPPNRSTSAKFPNLNRSPKKICLYRYTYVQVNGRYLGIYLCGAFLPSGEGINVIL